MGPLESALETLLRDLSSVKNEAELIIVSGSSRAKQLNEGAKKATRDFLWFLHADSRLALKALYSLPKSLDKNPEALHYFNLRFLPDGPPLMFMNEIGCWIRSRILGIPFGDQGFAISRKNFDRIGGFPEDALYGEDHLFVWRARQKKIPLIAVGASLYTSARRYVQTGWAKLTWTYAHRWIRQAWKELKKIYQKERAKKTLLIFAKYPQAGYVKSRLAQVIGEAKAASAYKTMVELVVKNTKPYDGEYHQVLYYDPPECAEKFRSWLPIKHQEPQTRGDLGERMKEAFTQALAKTPYAVLIGTDCIDIDHSLIGKAFQNLEEADLVLGPAKDGGYYLMGCKHVHPELFIGIDWSTERVFSQTLQIAEKLKLRVACLKILEDIDTAEQYEGSFNRKK